VLVAGLGVVDRLLAGDRGLCAGQLAQGRADPGHAPVAAAGGGCRRRPRAVARLVAALPGRPRLAAAGRARLLVGLVRPRPPGLARPRQRHPPVAAPEACRGRRRAATVSSRTPAERRQRMLSLPPLRDADARAIEAFLDSAWAESGLSRQTLASYRRDLEGFARWRDGTAGGLPGADQAALFDYLAWRSRDGYSPRSNARLLSALRAFFADALRRGTRADDPTALLQPPRL